jgi:hypothetical protein
MMWFSLAVDTESDGTSVQLDVVGGSVGTDESARSDKLTGGRIIRTKLIAGETDVRITVNAPAFQLTLWQNGKEVSAYPIGIGHKDFCLLVGERAAAAIIFNPHWIPPGGAWVPRGNGVSRSRLSKIKISLSEGCMIREAAKADDIGRPVSRGCILMLGPDLLDLAEKLAAARNLAGTKSRSAGLSDSQFVINVADVRRGRLRRGRKLPLVDRAVEYEKEIALVRGGARK